MESEQVLSVPTEARWLFVIVILSADDLGLFEAAEFALARRADVNRDLAGKLLQMLADVDLVRFYEVNGKRYGFIPKFRQRLQIKRPRYPLPPPGLIADDFDALNKINDLTTKTTVGPPMDNGGASDGQPSEAEAEAEVIPNTLEPTALVATASPYRPPACPTAEIVSLYHKHLPALPAVEVLNEGRKRAASARWREVCADGKLDKAKGLEWFDWFFGYVAKSDFLMGRTPGKSGRTWKASFDFLVNPSKFARVVEGAYHEATQP
jgi:hypothetical protein